MTPSVKSLIEATYAGEPSDARERIDIAVFFSPIRCATILDAFTKAAPITEGKAKQILRDLRQARYATH